jgi:hypothetical protein
VSSRRGASRSPARRSALSTAYRIVYGIVASYIIARLAPDRPMLHAMIGGFVGLLLSTLGAVATWNRGPAFGPHWYPVSLIVSALPTAWIGAMIRLAHLRCPAAPRRAQVPAQSPDWAPHLGSKYRREQNPLHPFSASVDRP